MAYAPFSHYGLLLVDGGFYEAEHGHFFEFAKAKEGEFLPFGFNTKVFTGPDGGFRWAKVLKTVAYLIVDENADGSPVVEKWQIKGHRVYVKENA